MRLLFLGYSRIVQRRVLPAAAELPEVGEIEIASRRADTLPSDAPALQGRTLYADFDQAIRESKAEFVYVSTVNSEHAFWTQRALESGRHVIVDKPAATSLTEVEAMLETAQRAGCCLAESVVYPYHPLVRSSKRLLREHELEAQHLVANFSFPPLDADNFRYQRALGGGALLDLGPYAVSPGRCFFGELPQRVECQITGHNGEGGVETGFSVLFRYSAGRTLTGHFGFDSEYTNRLTVLGRDLRLEIERVFTPPAEPLELLLRSQNQTTRVQLPAQDPFAAFLTECFGSIAVDDTTRWHDDLYMDAQASASLHQAAQRETA